MTQSLPLHFSYSTASNLRIFHTPHFLHSALHIFGTSHFQNSTFSTLYIFYTPHYISFALPIFKTPHFPQFSFSTLRTFHTPHFYTLHSTYTGRFQFPLLEAVHCVSTKCLMEVLSDCSPSSSCLLSLEYWNLVQNNNNIRVKETKM